MAKERNFGTLFLQIALGIMFIVSGIWIFMGSGNDEIVKAIENIFDGKVANIICYTFAVIELIAGVFLFIRIFVNLNTKFDSVLMIIIMICWIAAIIVLDILGSDGIIRNLDRGFLKALYNLSTHLLVLGAIIKIKY